MLVATRDDHPRAEAPHFVSAPPPRSAVSRFTGAVQLVGSLIGIPLALIGGYSTYHANFSPEAKCQALRTDIVTMLDKKADASTLRMLVHRDVVAFERDCGQYDSDAVAAFKTLLAGEKSPSAPPRRAAPVAKTESKSESKIEKTETAAKTEAKIEAKTEAKAEAKTEAKIARTEAGARIETWKKAQAAAAAIMKREAVKAEAAKTEAAKSDNAEPEKSIQDDPPAVPADSIDATWVASVRQALRESALRPPAETAPELAAPMPPPIVVAPPPGADVPARADDHPVPPAPIPNAN